MTAENGRHEKKKKKKNPESLSSELLCKALWAPVSAAIPALWPLENLGSILLKPN